MDSEHQTILKGLSRDAILAEIKGKCEYYDKVSKETNQGQPTSWLRILRLHLNSSVALAYQMDQKEMILDYLEGRGCSLNDTLVELAALAIRAIEAMAEQEEKE